MKPKWIGLSMRWKPISAALLISPSRIKGKKPGNYAFYNTAGSPLNSVMRPLRPTNKPFSNINDVPTPDNDALDIPLLVPQSGCSPIPNGFPLGQESRYLLPHLIQLRCDKLAALMVVLDDKFHPRQ